MTKGISFMKKYKFVRKIVLGIMVLSLISGLLPASGFAEEELCGAVDGVYIGSWNGSDFVWKIDDKGGYSNTKGLWVSNRNLETTDENGVEKYGVFTITVNVESGKTYAYGFKAKADRASGVKVRVDWGASTSVLSLGNSFDWKNFEYRYTHTSAAASAKLRFTFSGSTKNMWFDDFYCYEVADGEFIGTNLVPNPDFDKSVSLATEKLKDEFSYEEYQNLSSVLPVYPVFKTDGKNIDGDMSDWAGEKKMSFPVSDSQRTVKLTSKVPDNTADAYYAFDDEYLYILAAVEDDIHIPILDAATYWQGDSLQVALAKKEDTYGAEMGFALDEKTGDMLVTYRNGVPSEKLLAKGKREGTKTVYEIKIPWDIYFEKCPGEYKFSIAINDNDGFGRANMLEIAPGICTGKKSAEFPTFKNIADENSFIAFADANSKAKGKEDNIINICVLNFGNDADFNVSGEWFGAYSVKLKKNSGFKKSVVYNTAETGEKTIYANVLSNGKKIEIPVLLEVLPTDEMIGENGEIISSGRFDEVEKLEKMTPDERFKFWQNELSRCIRCNACRDVCPACTCEKCVFDNPNSGVENKAASNEFEEKMFHIIRAFHVAGRCTDCGECSRVCPQHIPLHLLNRKFIKDINSFYGDYQAGEEVGSRAPVVNYTTEDLEPGEAVERGEGNA